MDNDQLSGKTSDYRGLPNATSTEQDLQNSNENQSRNSQSYASAASRVQFPAKSQAIIFPSVEGIRLETYITALGPLVQPKNILFSSRISNNRVSIYLSSKEIVDKFMKEHGAIIIDNIKYTARRLITPSERLVLSNVCPSIPHQVIEASLRNINLKLITPITFLKIGISNPEYNHVFSFRRQVYIMPSENSIIPETLILNHEGTPYRIFLSCDGLSCFNCKLPGHFAAQCPSQTTSGQTVGKAVDNNSVLSNATESSQITVEALVNVPPSLPVSQEPNAILTTKRQISEDSTIIEMSKDTFLKPTSHPPKKIRTNKTGTSLASSMESITSCEELLRPAKEFIEGRGSQLPLTYDQIVDFFDNVHGSSDPLLITKEYTKDISAVLEMLTDLYPHLESRSLKNRCTRLRKKITKQLCGENVEESDSDMSQTSY